MVRSWVRECDYDIVRQFEVYNAFEQKYTCHLQCKSEEFLDMCDWRRMEKFLLNDPKNREEICILQQAARNYDFKVLVH